VGNVEKCEILQLRRNSKIITNRRKSEMRKLLKIRKFLLKAAAVKYRTEMIVENNPLRCESVKIRNCLKSEKIRILSKLLKFSYFLES
jgi:hypothetical protein